MHLLQTILGGMCVSAFTVGKLRLNSRIKPRMYMYVRRITTCMYKKSCILLAGTGVRKNSTVACGFSPIKSIILISQSVLSTE